MKASHVINMLSVIIGEYNEEVVRRKMELIYLVSLGYFDLKAREHANEAIEKYTGYNTHMDWSEE